MLMYNKADLKSFIKDDGLIENIIENQKVANLLEGTFEKDKTISNESKAIIYKHVLIILFSTLEAALRGFLLKIREDCSGRDCKEMKSCDYCKSKDAIRFMKVMSPINEIPKDDKGKEIDFLIDYLEDIRLIGFEGWKDKLFRLKKLRNTVHLSNKSLETDIEVFNEDTITDIFEIMGELFNQLSISMRNIKDYEEGCLKELDDNAYEFTRQCSIRAKEYDIEYEKERELNRIKRKEAINRLRKIKKEG